MAEPGQRRRLAAAGGAGDQTWLRLRTRDERLQLILQLLSPDIDAGAALDEPLVEAAFLGQLVPRLGADGSEVLLQLRRVKNGPLQLVEYPVPESGEPANASRTAVAADVRKLILLYSRLWD